MSVPRQRHPDLRYLAVPDEEAENRPHPEPAASGFLKGFELDRWRLLNCSAFRRLQYKTQAFLTHEGDHYRTRLTHTLEVSQLARLLCRMLGLNETLAECLAFVHDLGHPPFGHAGERALVEGMSQFGGFEHNAQALRIVDYLEHPYRYFYGLNLAQVIRWSLQLHTSPHDAATRRDVPADWRQGPLEGQVLAVADRLAYDLHDIEDAIAAGLIDETHLSQVSLWQEACCRIRRTWPTEPLPAIRRHVLDEIARILIRDLMQQTDRNLASLSPTHWQQVCTFAEPVLQLSPQGAAAICELETFLRQHVYSHPKVAEMDRAAAEMIKVLFSAYMSDPHLLPERYRRRIPEQGLARVVCDYIAGMTDRFCQREYERIRGSGA